MIPGPDERITVVILFGGRSSEHGISCVTAAGVLRAIDRARFDVILVGIAKNGATVLVDEHEVQGYRLDGSPEVVENGTRILWPASTGTRTLTVIESGGAERSSEGAAPVRSLGRVDVVLPMLHGPYGEDGTVQGMLDLVDLPYAGSGVLGSALCMDKHALKTVLAAAGIAVAPWRTVSRSEVARDPSLVCRLDEGLGYPLFVKPNRAGSSVGVSRVTAPDQLPAALDVAFAEDSLVLVESGVVGREVEIAVLQGRSGEPPRTSAVIGEIVFSGREFYDFEAKYLGAAGVDLVLPAGVTDAEFAALRDAAVTAFEVSQCAGFARVDFFLTADGPVLNEINTLPGFTPISMYPRLWEASGLGYTELITELVELALEGPRPGSD
ncbi:D-alanine--D-alanine ligase [Leucobacter weissii]|uniref:D-alanine--D-alanine ligase n=1 Tax=Leucobacter weissii TaxID=1983706 RepID=A0A939MIX5_9MICO|nr:D-alanine--D-alanine ligase [Leucobacter weissii]